VLFAVVELIVLYAMNALLTQYIMNGSKSTKEEYCSVS